MTVDRSDADANLRRDRVNGRVAERSSTRPRDVTGDPGARVSVVEPAPPFDLELRYGYRRQPALIVRADSNVVGPLSQRDPKRAVQIRGSTESGTGLARRNGEVSKRQSRIGQHGPVSIPDNSLDVDVPGRSWRDLRRRRHVGAGDDAREEQSERGQNGAAHPQNPTLTPAATD
jgi:hypothetical protein